MFFKKILLIGFCFVLLKAFSQKTYHKIYYKNGNLKEEGWIKKNKKNGYWKFYYENGVLKSKGHFKDNLETKYWYFFRKNSIKEKEGHYFSGKQNKWWLYYDDKGHIYHKCQLKDNKKNGYCLIYKMEKLTKVAKFQQGKKIKEWTDLKSFKKDNNLSDLKE
ncbi:MAG: hypothetical protein GKR88_15785 [Flavobacteriaceae bacterium]|nr:MAG: hypothetical protein GKR88_15785 [Flavobacteriaceae bacterium]